MPSPSDTPLPKVRLITQDLLESLNAIRISAGRSCDLEVAEPKFGGEIDRTAGRGTLITATETPAEGGAVASDTWDQTYYLLLFVGQSENSEEPLAVQESLVRAELKRALIGNDQAYNRSGLALSTSIAEIAAADPTDATLVLSVLVVTIVVTYRTDLGTPFSA